MSHHGVAPGIVLSNGVARVEPSCIACRYVFPLLVGLGVTVQAADWQLGYFTRVAQIVRL